MATTAAEDTDVTAPVVIDLGKTKRSRIKDLKRGQGRILDEVQEVVEQVRTSLGDGLKGRLLVPVVVIYKQKSKRGKRGSGMFGF